MQMNGGNGTIGDASRKVKDDLGALASSLSRSKDDLGRRLAKMVREQPLATIGLAFGIGYVLGGGLFSRTTSRLLRVGLRLGGVQLARNLFAAAGNPDNAL